MHQLRIVLFCLLVCVWGWPVCANTISDQALIEDTTGLLNLLSEHWRWAMILVFLLIFVGLMNTLLPFGKKRKRYSLSSLNNETLINQFSSDYTVGHELRDHLTGLPNRTLFLDRLKHAININARTGKKLAVVIIDLDQFKRINDEHGHDVGDQILRIVSDRFREVMRKTDTIARLGGDEFIVLVQGFNENANVTPIVEKMLTVLQEPIAMNGHISKVGASVGISIYPDHGQSTEALLSRADLAIYKAKYTGDQILMYDESYAPGLAEHRSRI